MPTIIQQPSYPDINGIRYDHSALQISIPAANITPGPFPFGLISIDYSDDLKPAELYGNSPMMLGRTRGRYTCKAQMKLYKLEAENFIAYLGARGLTFVPYQMGYKEVSFNITLNYAAPNQPVQTDVIVGCRITEDLDKSENNQNANEVTFNLMPVFLVKNGVLPFQPDQLPLWSPA